MIHTRLFAIVAFSTALGIAQAENVTLVADFAPGSTQEVTQAGTDFTVRLTLARPDGPSNSGMTGYDLRFDFDDAVFEVTGYDPLVGYLPSAYVVAIPVPGVDPPATHNSSTFYHLTGADLSGSATPASGVAELPLVDVHLRTLTEPAYPLAFSFGQNNRPNRDQGPAVVFGQAALELANSVTFDHTAFGAPPPTPTPTPAPTDPTPTPTPTPTEPTPTPTPAFVDSDRDLLPDWLELEIGTDPFDRDTSGDGIEDGVKVAMGYDPLSNDDLPDTTDTDADLLPDFYEILIGTDPDNPDTSGNGFLDGYELAAGSDPLDPNAKPLLGDINMDGNHDFVDAIILINIYLGNVSPEGYTNEAWMDMNRDGNVDFVDAIILFNWVLGNVPTLPIQ